MTLVMYHPELNMLRTYPAFFQENFDVENLMARGWEVVGVL